MYFRDNITHACRFLVHMHITDAHTLANRATCRSWVSRSEVCKAQEPRFTYSRWSPWHDTALRIELHIITLHAFVVIVPFITRDYRSAHNTFKLSDKPLPRSYCDPIPLRNAVAFK